MLMNAATFTLRVNGLNTAAPLIRNANITPTPMITTFNMLPIRQFNFTVANDFGAFILSF